MASSAVSSLPPNPTDANSTIPLISITPLLTTSPLTLPTAQSLLSAFRTSGFFYLTDAPLPAPLLANIFAHSAHFFARPQSQKNSLAWTTPEANRGYTKPGLEKVSQGTTKEEVSADRLDGGEDLKESYEIGREDDPAGENPWPDHFDAEGAAFKTAMQDFFARCQSLHITILRGLALALNLPATFFDPFISRADNTLRLLHYPAVPANFFSNGRRVRAGLHTDYGSITLLFQDGRGGLQVELPGEPGGRFVDVEPVEGAIVVNSGDLLARWSNGLVRSTLHRVVEPPSVRARTVGGKEGGKEEGGKEEEEGYPPRYSIAYFCNPDFDRWIEALPGTWEGERGGKKFEGVWSGKYLVERLSATY